MDDKDMDELIRQMLQKPSNISHPASHTTNGSFDMTNGTGAGANGSFDMNNATGGASNGPLDPLNNETLIREKLSSYFLQQMLETENQKDKETTAAASAQVQAPTTAPQNGAGSDVKVDLSLPDVENLVKLLLQNVKVSNQDKSALEEEKAKRRALELEAEEMRQKIKMFERLSQPTEAAAVQKKLDAFQVNYLNSNKTGDSMQATMSKYIKDLMLKDQLSKKKLFSDPKWFPGSSKDAEQSNTNPGKDKDMFKEMLRNPHNPMQPGPSGQFHGGPMYMPHGMPYHGNAPPFQQNLHPMGHGGAHGMYPQQPPYMSGYGAPHGNMWHGPPHPGYQGPSVPHPGYPAQGGPHPGYPAQGGPFPGPKQAMPPQQESKKKQKQVQPQPQNPPKQKQQQQQNQPKQKQQQNQQQNQPKQKQQQNQPKQKQQQQPNQQQNQPKQNQAPNNLNVPQGEGKKKKNAQNQEQNKNGAQPKLTVPVGSCVTLSPNSSTSVAAAQNGGSKSSSGIKLTQDEINKLKQSIQMMDAQAAATGKKKRNKKKKKAGGEEGDDSGSGGEGGDKSNNLSKEGGGCGGGGGEMVMNELGGGGGKKKNNNNVVEQKKKDEKEEVLEQPVAAPGEGKKKNKKKNAGADGNQANPDFALYVGDRWPSVADVEAGRLQLDQPVKNILMVDKTVNGNVCSTPKTVQDMLIFHKLHPTAVLVFTSD
ncbi:protein MLP1 homolog isoform X2 [Nilaparvata lugens]|nr:protein MLP1 homolog isoform X2 [Nilaparvata lugens]XP_039294942.1 protein MLP1 homolog isoform X2 [Nilaparvata lugens]